MVYFWFCKMISLLWQICDILELIFCVAKGQILKNNLTPGRTNNVLLGLFKTEDPLARLLLNHRFLSCFKNPFFIFLDIFGSWKVEREEGLWGRFRLITHLPSEWIMVQRHFDTSANWHFNYLPSYLRKWYCYKRVRQWWVVRMWKM